MRAALILIALVAGCTDPEDELSALQSSTEIHCWDAGPSCGPAGYQVSSDQAIACMNDALSAGRRAEAMWRIYDSKMYTTDTYMFTTADHRIRVFISYPDDFGGPSTLEEQPSCAGPLHATTERVCFSPTPVFALAADGC